MCEARRRRIEDWIESVPVQPPPPTFVPAVEDRPAKRVCRGLDDPVHPNSPPLTDVGMDETPTGTPRGRKRAADDREQTPRPILPPSMPMRKRAKSTSPRKKTAKSTLELLDKPYNFFALPPYPLVLDSRTSDSLASDNQTLLPDDILPLYRQIYDATEREAILPHELRDKMAKYKLKSFTFKPPDTGEDASSRALAVYNTVCNVVQQAAEAQNDDSHESAWNHLVHTPLLSTVFASTSLGINRVSGLEPPPLQQGVSVRFVPAMSAQIEAHSLPMMRATNTDIGPRDSASVSASASASASDCQSQTTYSTTRTGSRSDSKRVDYVLAMDMPKTAPLQEKISRVATDLGCCGAPHVNQTAYRPLDKSLMAVSIETKTALPQQDALLQLGMWTAAWHDRMYTLRASIASAPTTPVPRLPTLPLIQVVGHLWQVYFACDMGTTIDLYGPTTIGSTETVISTYVLLSALHAIRAWVEGTFQDAMKSWFLVEDTPAAVTPVAD